MLSTAELHHTQELVHESLYYLHHSPRNQARVLHEWLETLRVQSDPGKARSFLVEAYAQFVSVIPKLSALGCAPEYYALLRADLAWLQSVADSGLTSSDIQKLDTHLLGQIRRLESWLGKPGAPDGGWDNAPAGAGAREILDAYLEHLDGSAPGLVDVYRGIAAEWDAVLLRPPGVVSIPVLENDTTHGALRGFVPYGSCAQLHMRVFRHEGSSDDDGVSHSGDSPLPADVNIELHEALHAIRSGAAWLQHGSQAQERLTLDVSFSENNMAIEGRSLGLGAAVCGLAEWSRTRDNAEYFTVPAGTVFTGRITGDGTVLPLEVTHCVLKAESLWYSPFSVLALPRENEAAVQQRLDTLRAAHPRRSFEVVPVRSLRDVFNNRVTIHTRRRPMRERVRLTLRRNMRNIAIVSSLLTISLLSTWLMFIADFDTNPSTYVTRDNQIVVMNARGKELWSVPHGPDEEPIHEFDIQQNGRTWSSAAIVDLNGDGRNEVVFGHPRPKDGFSDYIYCYNPEKEEQWRAYLGFPLETLEGNYLTCSRFRLNALQVLERDAVHPPRIVVAATNDAYSCTVSVVDTGGNFLGRYLHIGNLKALRTARVGQDRRLKILAAGTLNGYMQPVLVVLDPDHVYGVSPQSPLHTLLQPVLPPAPEMYYILFPIPDIIARYGQESYQGAEIMAANDSIVTVNCLHGIVRDDVTGKRFEHISLHYSFDPRTMRCLSAKTTSTFEDAYDWFVSKQRIPPVPRVEYARRLVPLVRYWNGTSFATNPTMNRRYMQRVDSIAAQKTPR